MDNTNSTIPVENFGAYLWDDLLEEFPASGGCGGQNEIGSLHEGGGWMNQR